MSAPSPSVRADGPDADVLAAADLDVERHRARFGAALDEPDAVQRARPQRRAGARGRRGARRRRGRRGRPGRQRLVAYLHDDATRPRPDAAPPRRAVPGRSRAACAPSAPTPPLRRAALVDVVEDGPWAGHAVVVRPTVMWALAGDDSADPAAAARHRAAGLATRSRRRATRFVAVTGDDRVRRAAGGDAPHVRPALPRRAGAGRPTTSGRRWCARRRSSAPASSSSSTTSCRPIGRRWIERADHLAWAITSRVELPIDADARPAVGATTTPLQREPTDEEWAAALGDIPRTHRLTADQLRLVERAHAASGGDLDARRAPPRQRPDRHARPAHPADAHVGRHRRVARPHPAAARARRPLPPRRRGVRRVGVLGRRRRGARSRCSPARRAPARRSPPRSSPASSASTCSSSTCRRSSASTSARPRRTSTRSSTRPGPATSCCSSTRPTPCSASAPRSRTPATATPTSRCRTSCSGSRPTTGSSSLATNFERNIDDAFLRRIHVRVEFAPARRGRAQGDLGAQPAGAARRSPATSTSSFLARQFELTGGSIRNAAAAGRVPRRRRRRRRSTWTASIRGVGREYQKLGRLLKAEDFGPYADDRRPLINPGRR